MCSVCGFRKPSRGEENCSVCLALVGVCDTLTEGFDRPGYLPVAVAILQGCKRSLLALREAEDAARERPKRQEAEKHPKGATAKKKTVEPPEEVRGDSEESYTYETEQLVTAGSRPKTYQKERDSGKRSKDAPREEVLEEVRKFLRLSQARDNNAHSGNSGKKVRKEKKRREGREESRRRRRDAKEASEQAVPEPTRKRKGSEPREREELRRRRYACTAGKWRKTS